MESMLGSAWKRYAVGPELLALIYCMWRPVGGGNGMPPMQCRMRVEPPPPVVWSAWDWSEMTIPLEKPSL